MSSCHLRFTSQQVRNIGRPVRVELTYNELVNLAYEPLLYTKHANIYGVSGKVVWKNKK